MAKTMEQLVENRETLALLRAVTHVARHHEDFETRVKAGALLAEVCAPAMMESLAQAATVQDKPKFRWVNGAKVKT